MVVSIILIVLQYNNNSNNNNPLWPQFNDVQLKRTILMPELVSC